MIRFAPGPRRLFRSLGLPPVGLLSLNSLPLSSLPLGLLLPGLLFLGFVGGHSILLADVPEPDRAEGEEFFEKHVRPLLAEKCYSCHGRGQQKGGLGLDRLEDLMAGGESGPAVVAGEPDASPLLEAIRYEGGLEMPPDQKLTDREIAVFEQWIRMGLPWPADEESGGSEIREDGTITDRDRNFWSFQPVREPPLPEVERVDWPRRSIDYFVLQRLELEGFEPNPEVDRRTFIRRATFDLIGLPPTEEEIQEFLADEGEGAYQRLIDRLLESPHYGERWGRHWLDVARYGEDQAHTFQARRYPSGYRYRDWVTQALNRDLPIDQFLLEQIAGDLLPGDDRIERLPALGFFALGPVYYADAGCAPKAKADEYDDRIDTLTRGILGLTVACARCHDHKFDPISAQDYYALAGVFASSEYIEAPLVPDDVVQVYEKARGEIEQLEKEYQAEQGRAGRELSESLVSRVARYLQAAWLVRRHRADPSDYSAAEALREAGLVAEEVAEEVDELVLERWLRFLESDRARQVGVLAEWQELVAELLASPVASSVESSDESSVESSVGSPGSPSSESGESGEAVALVESVESVEEELAARLDRLAVSVQDQLQKAVEVRHEEEARHREQVAALEPGESEPKPPALPDEVAGLLRDLVDHREAPLAIPADRLEKLLPTATRQALAARKKQIEEREQAAPPKYPVAHSLTEGKPVDSRLHRRGNVNDQGEEVERRFLAILSSESSEPFREGSGRLELARKIVDPENPLTARVFVNRVWQHHFGRGIVGTPSNFGLLGERPTHPELLDYLAARFVASGWSLKQLHREMMLSTTYRLASTDHPDNFERDPDNRLLWRMNRRRLDIESWRDALLSVSGNLEPTIGGPSVELHAGSNRRRTHYAVVSRHELNSTLRLFDFPDPNLTSERRSLTTVPMQQLFVLNSEFMISQARSLVARLNADRIVEDGERIDALYRWIFGRSATDDERSLAESFLSAGVSEEVAASVRLSAWEQYAQALLSTNEFYFVD